VRSHKQAVPQVLEVADNDTKLMAGSVPSFEYLFVVCRWHLSLLTELTLVIRWGGGIVQRIVVVLENPMETPAECKPTTDTNARKVCPEVQRFIERVVVPALVKRYIRELQEGKRPTTAGSVGESETISENP
jgi:hypothetical protein